MIGYVKAKRSKLLKAKIYQKVRYSKSNIAE